MTKRVKDEELDKVSGGMDNFDRNETTRPPGGSGKEPPQLYDGTGPGSGGGPIDYQVEVQDSDPVLNDDGQPGHLDRN